MAYLKRISPFKVFLGLFIISLCASYFFVKSFVQLEYASHKASAYAIGESQSALISSTIFHNMSANYALASLIRFSDGNVAFFDSYSEELKKQYPLTSHFSLSPGGIITQVYPLEGNESSIGLNQLSYPDQREMAQLTKQSQKLTLAGPINLVQGGKALIGRWPVWIEEDREPVFWGFTNVTIKLERFLQEVNLIDLEKQGFHYRLERINDNDINSFVATSTNHLIQDHDWLDIDIVVPNGQWLLRMSPKNGWLSKSMLFTNVTIALILSLLFSGLVSVLWRISLTKQALEATVEERTKEVTRAYARMSSLMNAIPDMLFEYDEDGILLYCHSPTFETVGIAFNKMIGCKIDDFLPKHVAKSYYNSFAEAKKTGHSIGNTFSVNHKKGVRWFELSVTYSSKEENINGARYVVVSRDITSRKEAELELRIAATAFESQDAVIITDMSKRILRVNKAFEGLTGYSEKEVLGKTTEILNSSYHDEHFYKNLFAQLMENSYWEGEIWSRKKDGSVYPELLSISIVYDSNGLPVNYVAIAKDITLVKQNEHTINQLNFYDSLTSLPNRRMVQEYVENILSMRQSLTFPVRHTPKANSAILFVDLDNFKNINDTKGHPTGDLFLQQVAERLLECAEQNCMVARFGGDEFIVVLTPTELEMIKQEKIGSMIQKIQHALSTPIFIKEERFDVSSSIGLAEIDHTITTAADVFKNAELAMYEAKAAGRSQVCYYSEKMQEKLISKMNLELALRDAISNNEFELYYQPQFDRNGDIQGVEALIRWFHPVQGLISPMLFIPLAEESKLILSIGDWVTRTACLQLKAWQSIPELKHITISVNVSALQFSQEEFVSSVESILKETGVPANQLQLELTESMLIMDKNIIAAKMSALNALGILFSLDDFGTGYSSLSYLQKLPFDQLKIDQSFVRNLSGDDAGSLAHAIAAMGSSLGLEVIAEGVETQEQFDLLKQCNCDLFQGYFMGYPVPVKELESRFSSTQ